MQAQCSGTGTGAGTGAGGGGTNAAANAGGADICYLHADHLGRPAFATDSTGTVVWDAGGQVTPFGDGINTAAAFAQNLQFPGQYYDAETGLSHNHHRTYDPALGRYLQSDPIGLTGGLNRYAYVGGNPVSFIDPTGEIFFFPILFGMVLGAAIDIGFQVVVEGKSLRCLDKKSILISAGLGAFGGGGAFLRNGVKRAGMEWSHAISKKSVDKMFRKGGKLNKFLNKRSGLNGQWVSPKRHSRHDWWRRLKGEEIKNKPHKILRGLDRVPDYIKGSVGMPLLNQPSKFFNNNCGCE